MPEHLAGSAEGAQLVIAAFVAGTASGLLVFGSIGPRFGQRQTLIAAIAAYALLSLACASCGRIDALVAVRFLQGVAASGLRYLHQRSFVASMTIRAPRKRLECSEALSRSSPPLRLP